MQYIATSVLCLLILIGADAFSVSKMDAFRPFRPEDPIREVGIFYYPLFYNAKTCTIFPTYKAIEFCGNSLTSLFSPLSTAAITEERRQLNFPITKSSRRLRSELYQFAEVKSFITL